MTDFIMSNIGAIGSGLVALILIVYALITRRWMVLRSAALSLMLSAEKLMATEEGKKKMDAVYRDIWRQVPAWLGVFVTEETLREKLQEWYDHAKDMLSRLARYPKPKK